VAQSHVITNTYIIIYIHNIIYIKYSDADYDEPPEDRYEEVDRREPTNQMPTNTLRYIVWDNKLIHSCIHVW